MASIQDVDPSNVKRMHGLSHGRLYKGSSVVAANATIPTKYQTVILSNADKRGFQSSSRRFQYEMEETEQPGPGAYQGLNESESTSPSWSKKGTGGFASKSRRVMGLTDGRGTATANSTLYQLPATLQSRVDFNKSNVSRLFHQDIAEHREKRGDLPGPNQYNLSEFQPGRKTTVSAQAAFKSVTKRDLLTIRDLKSVPAPNVYDTTKADKHIYEIEKAPVSSFKSQSKRDAIVSKNTVPGPGSYHPFENTTPPPNPNRFQMQHYLCLSAPALPLPPTAPMPGPGQYNLAPPPQPKHFMSSSMFLSNASRWGNTPIANGGKFGQPGPAQYHPVIPGKQTFLYNSKGLWV